jgi:hypothetical protein
VHGSTGAEGALSQLLATPSEGSLVAERTLAVYEALLASYGAQLKNLGLAADVPLGIVFVRVLADLDDDSAVLRRFKGASW